MSAVPVTLTVGPPAAADPAGLVEQAAAARKCAACGCAHEASAALAGVPATAPPQLREAAAAGRVAAANSPSDAGRSRRSPSWNSTAG